MAVDLGDLGEAGLVVLGDADFLTFGEGDDFFVLGEGIADGVMISSSESWAMTLLFFFTGSSFVSWIKEPPK